MCLIYFIDVIIHPHRGVLHTVARPGARYNRSDVLIDNAPEEVDEYDIPYITFTTYLNMQFEVVTESKNKMQLLFSIL